METESIICFTVAKFQIDSPVPMVSLGMSTSEVVCFLGLLNQEVIYNTCVTDLVGYSIPTSGRAMKWSTKTVITLDSFLHVNNKIFNNYSPKWRLIVLG